MRGYVSAMWICAVMLAAGGIVSWLLIRNPEPPEVSAAQPAPEVRSTESQPSGIRHPRVVLCRFEGVLAWPSDTPPV